MIKIQNFKTNRLKKEVTFLNSYKNKVDFFYLELIKAIKQLN